MRAGIRGIIGILFVFSGLAKAFDLYSFVTTLSTYPYIPHFLVVPLSVVVPTLEVALGLMLLLNVRARVASASLIAMLLAFTAISALKYYAGGTGDCGCFGSVVPRKLSAAFFAENAVIIVALSFTLLKTEQNRRNPSEETYQ